MQEGTIVSVNDKMGVVYSYLPSVPSYGQVTSDKVFVIDTNYNTIYEGNSANVNVILVCDNVEEGVATLKTI